MTDNGTFEEAKRRAEFIQRLSDDCWHALDASCRTMDDDAWVGPVARRFHEVIRADQRELWAQLSKAVRDAEAKLATIPRP
ncbi:hypothetical protein FM076_27265 [Streptomyces albus subsp. chlorinus]|uniref:hypothetical protein n=1 Tax=Streptomyces albus TaxID=1888 RepID=UPI00156DF41A|nr:hypothetical protein [Streptomyces albus]NSC24656.1 hypothetical protein [Streptomyces albus subsp. chlorinus]